MEPRETSESEIVFFDHRSAFKSEVRHLHIAELFELISQVVRVDQPGKRKCGGTLPWSDPLVRNEAGRSRGDAAAGVRSRGSEVPCAAPGASPCHGYGRGPPRRAL